MTRPSFATIEDLATSVGVPIHQAFDGDPAASRNAHGVLPAIDPSGNLRYLRLNDDNQLSVTLEAANIASLFDDGSVSGTTSFQTIATITLGNSYVYSAPEFHGSCFRDAVFEVVFSDNGVETKFPSFRVGAGNENYGKTLDSVVFTSGATGAQTLFVRGKLLQATPATALDAFIAVKEKQ